MKRAARSPSSSSVRMPPFRQRRVAPDDHRPAGTRSATTRSATSAGCTSTPETSLRKTWSGRRRRSVRRPASGLSASGARGSAGVRSCWRCSRSVGTCMTPPPFPPTSPPLPGPTFWPRRVSAPSNGGSAGELFGSFRDGFRPVGAYCWRLSSGRRLLEIPVTTIPIFKLPFHMSYLIYLSRFSRRLMEGYLRAAIEMCRRMGITPSFLLHPLDFLGAEQARQLMFFPGMDVSGADKRALVRQVLGTLAHHFTLVPMSAHAAHSLAQERLAMIEPARHQGRRHPAELRADSGEQISAAVRRPGHRQLQRDAGASVMTVLNHRKALGHRVGGKHRRAAGRLSAIAGLRGTRVRSAPRLAGRLSHRRHHPSCGPDPRIRLEARRGVPAGGDGWPHAVRAGRNWRSRRTWPASTMSFSCASAPGPGVSSSPAPRCTVRTVTRWMKPTRSRSRTIATRSPS